MKFVFVIFLSALLLGCAESIRLDARVEPRLKYAFQKMVQGLPEDVKVRYRSLEIIEVGGGMRHIGHKTYYGPHYCVIEFETIERGMTKNHRARFEWYLFDATDIKLSELLVWRRFHGWEREAWR